MSIPPRCRSIFLLIYAHAVGSQRAAAAGNATETGRHNLLMNETRLRADLFGDYDANVPGARPVVCKLELTIIYVAVVSTDDVMVIEAWWRHAWDDDRLTWDPDEYGISKLMIDQENLWMPDVTPWIVNGEPEIRETPFVEVRSDGGLFVSIPRRDFIFCKLDFTRFPQDTQRCDLTIGGWAHSSAIQVVEPHFVDNRTGVDLSYMKTSPEFQLREVTVAAHADLYTCCPDAPFRTIRYGFVLTRLSLGYLSAISVPLVAATYLGFFTFLLNPSSGERIGLCITVLLTSVATYIVAGDLIPMLGAWTQLTRLYVACLVSNCCAFLETAVVLLLALLSVEAQEGHDQWRSPMLMKAIDGVFWRVHVGVSLRWHYSDHSRRLRYLRNRAQRAAQARVQRMSEWYIRRCKKSEGSRAKKYEMARISGSFSEGISGGLGVTIKSIRRRSKTSTAAVNPNDCHEETQEEKAKNEQRVMQAHWQAKTITHVKWLIEKGVPTKQIVALGYATKLLNEGFEDRDSLDHITEADLIDMGFLAGHIRQIDHAIRQQIDHDAMLRSSKNESFTVAGFLFEAGVPASMILPYVRSFIESGFDNRQSIQLMKWEDLKELKVKLGHARMICAYMPKCFTEEATASAVVQRAWQRRRVLLAFSASSKLGSASRNGSMKGSSRRSLKDFVVAHASAEKTAKTRFRQNLRRFVLEKKVLVAMGWKFDDRRFQAMLAGKKVLGDEQNKHQSKVAARRFSLRDIVHEESNDMSTAYKLLERSRGVPVEIKNDEMLVYMQNWYMRCATALDTVSAIFWTCMFTAYLLCEYTHSYAVLDLFFHNVHDADPDKTGVQLEATRVFGSEEVLVSWYK